MNVLKYLKIIAGPIVGLLLYWLLGTFSDTPSPAKYVAMLGGWMAVWWILESVPIELTGLLPMILVPFAGIYPTDAMGRACAPYADKSVFFFLGGFALGIAVEKTELHRRGALILLTFAGTKAAFVVGAFMFCTAAISMWVNNTATTMLMLPLAMSVIATQSDKRFSTSLLIGIAYAASIGGMGTLVGTAPNIFFSGFMRTENLPIDFGKWMLLAVPLALVLLGGCWVWLVFVLWPMKGLSVTVPNEWIAEIQANKKLNEAQRWTLCIFATAAFLWLVHDPASKWFGGTTVGNYLLLVEDAWIAMLGMFALLIFPLKNPVLQWSDIDKLPWGILLLLGGGLSLAKAIGDSKLDQTIASGAHQLSWMPSWLIIVVVVIGVIVISELASNLATATTVIPILAKAASGLGLDETTLLIAAVLASSCGFMLPVATPPNTLVFAQRRFPARDMMYAGAGVNLMGIIAIPIVVLWLKPLLFS